MADPRAQYIEKGSDFAEHITGGIIAFRLEIEAVQAFRKMSTYDTSAIQKHIIDAARAQGEDAFANKMEQAP